MKHQQVSVDYWAMGKAMLTYGVLTILVWVMLRLINAVFTLPRRLRAQQASMEDTLKELQRRYPDMNFTEEDIKNAEKDLEELTKGNLDSFGANPDEADGSEKKQVEDSPDDESQKEGDKKTN